MISTSLAWKAYVKNSSVFHIKADMYDIHGRTTQLTDEDFMLGSVSFTDAMSGMSEIKFGALVTSSFSATLNNTSGKFDNWIWRSIDVSFGIEHSYSSAVPGSAIAGLAVVGVEADDTEEWIRRGFYTLDKPTSISNTIKIVGYDTLEKLNKGYLGLHETLTYPIQSNTLISSIKTYCNMGSISNPFSNFSVNEFDVDETTTCRQVFSWILETLGGYGRYSTSYQYTPLILDKWTIGEWGTSDSLNGGKFSSWTVGDAADGGTMSPWNTTTDIDGGKFYEGQDPYEIERIKTSTVMVDDIEITGIKAISFDNSTSATAGADGYVITIRDNPLVTESNVSEVATRAWGNVQGLKVRPFEANIFGDPSMEAGDVVLIKDVRGGYHISTLTNLNFTLCGNTRVSCEALTPQELIANQ